MQDVWDEAAQGALAEARAALREAAEGLRGADSARRQTGEHASVSFRGVYAQRFSANSRVLTKDCGRVVRACEELLGALDVLEREARARQEAIEAWRREEAAAVRAHGEWKRARAEHPEDSGSEPDRHAAMPPELAGAKPPSLSVAIRVDALASITAGARAKTSVSAADPAALQVVKQSFESAGASIGTLGAKLKEAFSNSGLEFGSGPWKWGHVEGVGLVLAALDVLEDGFAKDGRALGVIATAFQIAGASGQGTTLRVADSTIEAALARSGGWLARAAIDAAKLTAAGFAYTVGFAADPVNVATGALMEQELDAAFEGPTASLAVERTFNAADGSGGVFGPGWFSVLDERIEFGDGEARWRRADGRELPFPADGSGWGRSDDGAWGPLGVAGAEMGPRCH